MQTLKCSQLFHRGQTLPDLGEVRADSLDEGVFVTLAELAQKLSRELIFLLLFVQDEARPRNEREGQKLAIEGYASLTQIEKEPEGNVRDRNFEVTPKGQCCDCTEARDLLRLTLVRV
jgi:hypothetical protein